MKAKKTLTEVAQAWAAKKDKSTAKTAEGIARAAEKYAAQKNHGDSDPVSLEQLYLDDLLAMAPHITAQKAAAERLRAAKWLAAKEQLRALPLFARHFFAQSAPANTAKKYKRAAGEMLENFPFVAIASHAYAVAPWGKLRKKYHGENCLAAGLRTETNGRSRRACVSWHYADFTAIISPDRRKIYVAYPDGSTELATVSPSRNTAKVGGKIVRRIAIVEKTTIKPHHLRRYFSAPCRAIAPVTWVWDREEKAGYYLEQSTGEKYHTENRPIGSASVVYRAAIAVFAKRRAENEFSAKREAAKNRVATAPRSVYVNLADSLAAGNCPTGSRQFAEKLLADFGLSQVVPANILLQIRRDPYTERAAIWAAVRAVN